MTRNASAQKNIMTSCSKRRCRSISCACGDRAKQLATEIRAVLEPVLIRRNRLDLINDPVYSQEVTRLSNVEDPDEFYFELSPEQMEFYDQVIDEYFSEDGVSVGPSTNRLSMNSKKRSMSINWDEEENRTYQQQRNLYEFMRRLLVKRFESSFGAFAKSIPTSSACTSGY
jgi:SNF2 family DNA or RNA helicase